MLSLTITITGIDDVERALDRVSAPSVPGQIAKAVASQVVLPRLAQYPPASGKKQPFVSAQSRKYFFVALRKGQITVPYRRSGDLGKPGNWEEVSTGAGLVLKSKMAYSDLVRTKGKQAKYFHGTWPTDEILAQKSELDAGLVATSVLVEIIGNAGP